MKKRCMGKRAYFFIIDSMLALGVLAIGTFLIFTFYAQQPPSGSADILSEDIMGMFANSKLLNINNPEIGLSGTYWSSSEVKACNNGQPITPDTESTLLQQVAIFYELREINNKPCYVDEIARTFVEKLTQSALPAQYGFEFWIDDDIRSKKTLIYPVSEQSSSKAASKVLIPSRKIAYGILNQETGQVFGPYSAEVLVWRQ